MPSKRRTCDVSWCDAHRWPRRKGPHLRAEIVPAVGPIEAVVYRALNEDGTREAYMLRYDRPRWSGRLALPTRPRAGHETAVARARSFVRSGVLA